MKTYYIIQPSNTNELYFKELYCGEAEYCKDINNAMQFRNIESIKEYFEKFNYLCEELENIKVIQIVKL